MQKLRNRCFRWFVKYDNISTRNPIFSQCGLPGLLQGLQCPTCLTRDGPDPVHEDGRTDIQEINVSCDPASSSEALGFPKSAEKSTLLLGFVLPSMFQTRYNRRLIEYDVLLNQNPPGENSPILGTRKVFCYTKRTKQGSFSQKMVM